MNRSPANVNLERLALICSIEKVEIHQPHQYLIRLNFSSIVSHGRLSSLYSSISKKQTNKRSVTREIECICSYYVAKCLKYSKHFYPINTRFPWLLSRISRSRCHCLSKLSNWPKNDANFAQLIRESQS